jgi:hypothetical protein
VVVGRTVRVSVEVEDAASVGDTRSAVTRTASVRLRLMFSDLLKRVGG